MLPLENPDRTLFAAVEITFTDDGDLRRSLAEPDTRLKGQATCGSISRPIAFP